MTHQLTYSLELGTGEVINVMEVELDAPDQINEEVLELCTVMPRQVLEEAKIGHTRPFEKLLKTPPIGAMLRLDATCEQIHDCPSADVKKCRTSYVKKGRSAIPQCWTCDGFSFSTEIVHAWKDGVYVILVQTA